jgi:hypothetical protein
MVMPNLTAMNQFQKSDRKKMRHQLCGQSGLLEPEFVKKRYPVYGDGNSSEKGT